MSDEAQGPSEGPKYDKRLLDGVAYFEKMLKVMPEDRTTLEFLAVAYPQIGEHAKYEQVLAQLALVLVKEGDLENAKALASRLEECTSPEAQAALERIQSGGRHVEPTGSEASRIFQAACASESKLALKLDDMDTAAQMRSMPDNGRLYLVSALSMIERDHSDVCEQYIAKLADEYREPPIPLDVFEPNKELLAKLPSEIVKLRGVIPFARMGEYTLVVTLSPHDDDLKRTVAAALGTKVRFYITEPRFVEAMLLKIYPEDAQKNA